MDRTTHAHTSLFRLHPPRLLPKVDWLCIGIVLAITAGGIITIWGASSTTRGDPGPLAGFARTQLRWMILGACLMVAAIAIDDHWPRALAWALYFGLIVLLLAVLMAGTKVNGARSWLVFHFGTRRLGFQPSELGKIVVVIVLARHLADRGAAFRGWRDVPFPLLIAALPVLLILCQPDLGTAMVYLPPVAAMFFVAGLRKRIFVIAALAAAAVALLAYPHLRPYQKDRIQSYLHPGEDARGRDYNVIQARMALGSGGFFGKGWAGGTQTAMRFLPAYQTDFIFPTLGEQFGLAGCLVLLALYGLLLLRLAQLASRLTDPYGVTLITGFATVLMVHIIFNIGMVTRVVPVTGVPLPFFSYGGTFLVTCYMMIGLSAGVAARREG